MDKKPWLRQAAAGPEMSVSGTKPRFRTFVGYRLPCTTCVPFLEHSP